MAHLIVRLLIMIAGVGMLFMSPLCTAQPRLYIGAAGGISTLSADARTVLGSDQAATSSYKPENGPTAGVYLGVHGNDYLSVQADYLWNRNLLTLDALVSKTMGGGTALYEQTFRSHQHAALGSVLLYFRPRSSWVRPFLSVGTGIVHLDTEACTSLVSSGISAPGPFSATNAALHVAVGIDLKTKSGWALRYSFAETSGANPISSRLTPPGSRMLANFRNLFGVVKYF